MINITVVYHSGYGHTAVVAESVAKGAKNAGAETSLIKVGPDGSVSEADWERLDAADAIVFGAPTYMGSASGPFKVFMDATSRAWFSQKWKDKLAGGFTVSHSLSGDKLATLQQFSVLAAQHGMIWVSTGMLPGESETPHQRAPETINRIGSSLGVMAQAENSAPDQTPPSGDLKTAELYGERIAVAAQRWKS
jgi:NAD(P)H dehydrogenase (quinone)